MVAGGLLPLIILSLIIGPRVYEALLDDALLHNHSINSRIADQFNDEIKRFITLLENKSDPIAHIVGRDSITDLDLIDILFTRVMFREQYIAAVALVRPDGGLIAHADRHQDIYVQSSLDKWSWLSKEIHNESLLQFPVKDRVYISPVLREKDDNEHFHFLVTVPVGNPNHPVAILVAELAARDLLKGVMRRFSRPDYNTYFVSSEGELLYARTAGGYDYGESLKHIEIVGVSLENINWDDKKIYRGIDGASVFGAVKSISSVNWKVVSEIQKSDILFPIYETIITSYIIILIVVVLFIWLGVFIAGQMIAPIKSLTESFKNAARQDYSPSLIKSSLEEFQQLATGYDTMIDEIRNHEQKLLQSSKALKENEEHFRMVTENIHEVLMIFSAYWEEVIYVSPAYEEIWGFSCDSLYKYPPSWVEIIHPLDRTSVNIEISKLMNEAVQFPEYRIQLPTGDIRWVLAKIYPVINEMGELTRYVFIVQDVTEQRVSLLEQKKLQQQLQQSQKMEAIGQLTGGIAHDFNNMLTSIMGYTSLALDRFGKEIDPKLVEYLSEVDIAGERARSLISQLLVFSRESVSEPEPINLSPLIKEVIKMLQTSFPANVEIRNRINSDLPLVLMDPVRLHQLIMNLCINARDAIDGQGFITITAIYAGPLSGDCDACFDHFEGDFVELKIEDTGSGIEPSVMERIFDPFFTTKELGKGTGMGLSIVHGIMHDLGGHILVKTGSTGTSFKLLFPVEENQLENDSVHHQEPEPVINGRGQHILIIDDEISVARFESELLTHHGFQTTVMTDSEMAKNEFLDNPDKYDLVLTDQTMPKLTGTELAQILLKTRPDLPIIIFTGYAHDLDAADIDKIGIMELHMKPIHAQSFLKMIHKYLA